ncbi:ASCH/PUA domain-containing protein [Paenibacillus filicis]|uniref:ASCH/PUA domain-containing protein n=1 Tax=Paenibacillus filicis TaxID=669464 RepID=A0ABU9DHP9_9BACL
MKEHRLKTWPQYFRAVVDGSKPFEIRENDRDYQVGDKLILLEWDELFELYTGASIQAEITYLTAFAQRPNHVVMGIKLLKGEQS